jgi:hypothetical protein
MDGRGGVQKQALYRLSDVSFKKNKYFLCGNTL